MQKLICNQGVGGSSPSAGTNKINNLIFAGLCKARASNHIAITKPEMTGAIAVRRGESEVRPLLGSSRRDRRLDFSVTPSARRPRKNSAHWPNKPDWD